MENHLTAERIANLLIAENIDFEHKRMFGGDCFMVDDKMLMGTYKNGVMARVGAGEAEALANRRGAQQMNHAGKPMKGYLFLDFEAYESEDDLLFWVNKCLMYNPLVVASKKKK